MLKKQNTKQLFTNVQTGRYRIAIVKTDYHDELVSMLERYAVQTLIDNGVEKENIATFTAPGSWEIPILSQTVAKSQNFDAIIAFGVIVKGETYHFDMIANEVARALMALSLEHNKPIALEILAVYDMKHAVERASDNETNKGIEAALAVLKTLIEKERIANYE